MHTPCGHAYGIVIAEMTATPLAVREGFSRRMGATRERTEGSTAAKIAASVGIADHSPWRQSSTFARCNSSFEEIAPERTPSTIGATSVEDREAANRSP